jgi:hypothetical protein
LAEKSRRQRANRYIQVEKAKIDLQLWVETIVPRASSWDARANISDQNQDTEFFAGVHLSYWIDQPPSSNNLRLFQSDGTWLAWDDREEDGKTRRGAKGQVEERLLSAMNATNLIALLGSGASFAAKNAGGKQAPGMGDLWDDALLIVTEN